MTGYKAFFIYFPFFPIIIIYFSIQNFKLITLKKIYKKRKAKKKNQRKAYNNNL